MFHTLWAYRRCLLNICWWPQNKWMSTWVNRFGGPVLRMKTSSRTYKQLWEWTFLKTVYCLLSNTCSSLRDVRYFLTPERPWARRREAPEGTMDEAGCTAFRLTATANQLSCCAPLSLILLTRQMGSDRTHLIETRGLQARVQDQSADQFHPWRGPLPGLPASRVLTWWGLGSDLVSGRPQCRHEGPPRDPT